MTENQTPLNQTQFSFEEPIFEDKAVYMEEKPAEEPTEKPKSKKKLLIITAVAGIVLILVAILLIIIGMRNGNGAVTEEEPEVIVAEELGPLQRRIEDARELLDLADPTKQDLAFPPVNMGVRLDPKEK